MSCWSRLLAALSTALAFATAPALAADDGGYRFSPVNQYGISLTAAYWNPIIAYVSEKSGVKLQLKIGRTSADTTSYVLAQEVEFVFSNHLFSPEREHMGWKVFGRRVTPPVHGQIVVPADSTLTDIDLALMHSAKVPEQHVKAIAAAFVGMHTDPAGRDILEQASSQVGLTAEAYFIPSDGSEYAPYRDFYRNAPPSLR